MPKLTDDQLDFEVWWVEVFEQKLVTCTRCGATQTVGSDVWSECDTLRRFMETHYTCPA